jgi:hypothetical protein
MYYRCFPSRINWPLAQLEYSLYRVLGPPFSSDDLETCLPSLLHFLIEGILSLGLNNADERRVLAKANKSIMVFPGCVLECLLHEMHYEFCKRRDSWAHIFRKS